MAKSFSKTIKKYIYGDIPYLCTKIIHPDSKKLKYYKYFKDNGYVRPPYDFAHEYLNMPVEVYDDNGKGLKYVMHREMKKLYFPKSYPSSKIVNLYRMLMLEQDLRSPHHYVDSLDEFNGKTMLDIGSAEGMTSLDAIEHVNFIYLFECEPKWIEALNATFEPWKEKVQIIKKYISNRNDEMFQTLDDFFKDKPKTDLFLKMDIEGEERNALSGANSLFAKTSNLDFAICTYHKKDDEKIISSFLDKHNCKYVPREGLFYTGHSLRTCLLRGSKI